MDLIGLSAHCCSVCGKRLLDAAYRDWDGNYACEEHKNCLCYCCGRTYGKNAIEIEPHVWLCESYSKTIPDKNTVKSVISYIRTFYKQNRLEVKSHVFLKGVSVSQMEQQYAHNVRGYVIYPPEPAGFTMVVLRHLSKTALALVLSHEMLHIWQYENQIFPPQSITEGFCNLGAYLILQSIGTKVATGQIFLLTNSADPIYGDGFRKMKNMYERQGLQAVIAYMQSFKR